MTNPTQINQGGAQNQERQSPKQTGQGLRGKDMQQDDLRDQTSNMREPVKGDPSENQRSPRQDMQHGAEVRGNPPMVQGTSTEEAMPEGLRRERKGPYDKNVGRNENVTRVARNWNPKEGV